MPVERVVQTTRPLESIRPVGYNPRKIKSANRERLKRGILEFGIVMPFVVKGETGELIGGHQRLSILDNDLSQEERERVLHGQDEAPVTEIFGLTDHEMAALNVLLNNAELMGDWDWAKLTDLISELDGSGFDASLTGFDAGFIQKLLTEPQIKLPDLVEGVELPSEHLIEIRCGKDQLEEIRPTLEEWSVMAGFSVIIA